MWARTLWPLLSSTRNIAFGRASTTVPSISITPSFFGMSSLLVVARFVYRRPGNLPDPRATSRHELRVDLLQPSRRPPPGRTRLAERESSGFPGSREAPRNRPKLGRRLSLGRSRSQPLIPEPDLSLRP